ncbi:MAG: hypothetical protein SGBAC_000393 [Bacillariaceae sp.]
MNVGIVSLLVVMVVPSSRHRSNLQPRHCLPCIAIVVVGLIVFWGKGLAYLLSQPTNAGNPQPSVALRKGVRPRKKHTSQLLSRSDSVTASSDVRGNLGPASVVIQKIPGTDWIKDRWQAASNMHGTAIKGAHWLKLDFGREIIVDKVILDWEAAYADLYKLEGSLFDLSNDDGADKWILFDGTDSSQEHRRTTETSGQSPGVKTKTPLHIIHTIDGFTEKKPIRYLRVFVDRSKMGWGVSLWQFDVYGIYADDTSDD